MTVKIFLCSVLLLSALGLRPAPSALAAPIQGTEPAIHSNAPIPSETGTGWRKFSSLEGHFSVLLPSVPQARLLPLAESGEAIHECAAREGKKVYIVFYRDLPPRLVRDLGATRILSINDSATLKVESNSLVSKRFIKLNDCPGYEMITNRPDGRMRIRHAYIAGNRFYTLDVLQPLEQTLANPSDADKFFDSFALLPAKTPTRNK